MEFRINLSSPSTTSSSMCGFYRGLVWAFVFLGGGGKPGGEAPRKTHISDTFKARQLGGWLLSHVIVFKCSRLTANVPSVCIKGTSRY